jgi:hypothetical protein
MTYICDDVFFEPLEARIFLTAEPLSLVYHQLFSQPLASNKLLLLPLLLRQILGVTTTSMLLHRTQMDPSPRPRG